MLRDVLEGGSIILIPILYKDILPADYGVIVILDLFCSFLFIVIDLNLYTGRQKYYYL
jgi:hypothetical protein